MPFAADQQRQKVPVTIITGFLGAGKTSLLNYLLKERGNKRIAVVENEFGEVNIDRDLVMDNLLEKEDLVSLENGCVCCSLRQDIVKAFADIEIRSCKRGGKPDSILLETTGLADPAPVAFTFFANPWVASRFKLDSILCVVDAQYLLLHLEDVKPDGAVNEAVQQIAFSDLILLNKVDLVSEEKKKAVLKAIRSINTTAQILECQLNDPAKCPPLEKILNVNSFSVSKALDVDECFLDSDSDDEEDVRPEEPVLTPNEVATAEAVAVYKQRRKQQLREAAEKLEAFNAEATTTTTQTSQDAPTSSCCRTDEGANASTSAHGEGDHESHQHQHVHAHEESGHKHHRDHKRSDNDCSCEDHPEEVLRKGEREPVRKHKKLHDLQDVSSVGIVAAGTLDSYRFNMFMKDLLQEKAKDIFRSKGVLAIHGQGRQKFIFQGVHETICYGPADHPWKEDEIPDNKLVFIGRRLDRKALIEGFRTCVWVPLPEGWEEFVDPKTLMPFYVEKSSGSKTWTRPNTSPAEVVASHASTKQPARLSSLSERDVEVRAETDQKPKLKGGVEEPAC